VTVSVANPVTTTEALLTDSPIASSVAPSRSTVPLPSVSTSTVCRVSANVVLFRVTLTGPATSVPVASPFTANCRLPGKAIASVPGASVSAALRSTVSFVPSSSRSKALAQSIRPYPATAWL
jgi:hypothetical protein